MTTLNDVIRRSGGPVPAMVKVDAEGFDLRVISGASDLIGVTDIFIIEAGVAVPCLENTAAAVISRMAAEGYRLIDVPNLNRSEKDDVLWMCDLAFVREGSSLFERVTDYE